MSMEIDGLGPLLPSAMSGPVAAYASGGAVMSIDDVEEDAVDVEIAGSLPPALPYTVLDAIGRAQDAYEQLTSSGRRVHFASNSNGGSLVIELQDLNGNRLRGISAGDVMRLAAGEDLN